MGAYDNANVEALVSGIVAYAQGIGANMLELRQACKSVAAACDQSMAQGFAELQRQRASEEKPE